MISRKVILKFACLFLLSNGILAQNGKIFGKIKDGKNNAPLSFSSVRVYTSLDSTLIDGNISDENGAFKFELPYGKYYIGAEYMGYLPIVTPFLVLSANNRSIDIGELSLQASINELDEVTVRAEKSTMELSLDKRIFNVGKDLANAGGSAAEILVNIPSVTVDIDGEVRLRGSSNVRILIDGKPSGLVSFKGGAGLAQLQASMVDRVEIITNPSARYEAEGMAGIINIILKKDQKQGFNGSLELTLGNPTNYGLAANVNYRHKKINFFLNYGLSYRVSPGIGSVYQETYNDLGTLILDQTTTGDVSGLNNNVRGGLDYFFSEKSILTLSYLLSRADGSRYTENQYFDYFNSLENPIGNSLRIQEEDEVEPLSETVLTYKRLFDRKGQKFTAEFRYLDHWEQSDQLFKQSGFLSNGEVDQAYTYTQHSLNDEFEKQYLLQVDYEQPIAKEGKFEIGGRSSFRDMVNDYFVKTIDGNPLIPEIDNYFIYDENIHAIYGILGNKQGRVSYQVGLRAEWTDVNTILRKTNEENPRNYMNLFPSGHFTYNLPKDNALQISYSRRVRRPGYNDLSPFMTVSDSRNFFSGNPDLDPEYTDSYELGHLKHFEKGSFTSAIYYRDTENKIARIRTVNDLGFATTFPENLIGEQSYGVELTTTYQLAKWWKFDLNFNLFHANTDGSNIDETYVSETNSWFLRQSSRFDLANDFDIQLRANYQAPQRDAQGLRHALYFFDLSASKIILKGNGTLSLSVLDLFNSRIGRSTSEGTNFYMESESQRRRRQINLTFNFRLNQANKERR